MAWKLIFLNMTAAAFWTVLQLLSFARLSLVKGQVNKNCAYNKVMGVFLDDKCMMPISKKATFDDALTYCTSNKLGGFYELRTEKATELKEVLTTMAKQLNSSVWTGATFNPELVTWNWKSDDSPARLANVNGAADTGCAVKDIGLDRYEAVACNKMYAFLCAAEVCPAGQFSDTASSKDCKKCSCNDDRVCDSLGGGCEEKTKTCPVGFFNPTTHCDGICRCHRGVPCDRVTGVCPQNKCDTGWKGLSCNEPVCHAGYWNPEVKCNQICQCKNDLITCHPATGLCPDFHCEGAWAGPTCREAICPSGTFNPPACDKFCHCTTSECNVANGMCDKCDDKYMGEACQELVCRPNTYKPPHCELECHCAGGSENCHPITGYCTAGCADGWLEREAGAGCVIRGCSVNTYGTPNCDKKCFCRKGTDCDIKTGKCPKGCKEGYFGAACNESSNISDKNVHYEVSYFIIIFLAVCIVFIVICAFFNANSKREQDSALRASDEPSSSVELGVPGPVKTHNAVMAAVAKSMARSQLSGGKRKV